MTDAEWHIRHNLHANLFAIHDTKCQFIHPKDEIHDAQASIHFLIHLRIFYPVPTSFWKVYNREAPDGIKSANALFYIILIG